MGIGTSYRSLASQMVGAAIATGAALAAYRLYVRPRHIRWGATDEEVERPMPGDEVLGHPNSDELRRWARRRREASGPG